MKTDQEKIAALRKTLKLVPKSQHKKILMNSIKLRRLQAEKASLLNPKQQKA